MMPTPVPMAWHGQKSHVAPHFYHLDIENAMMPFASNDTDTGTISITLPKIHFTPHFDHLGHNECRVILTMPQTSCNVDAGTMVSHDQIVMLHFILIILTFGWQWCHCQCHLHHVMLVPVPMATYKHKCSCCISFYHLDLKHNNAI